jgi:uncharacterized membrane protein YdjX (TVP38/TMEM64 family)
MTKKTVVESHSNGVDKRKQESPVETHSNGVDKRKPKPKDNSRTMVLVAIFVVAVGVICWLFANLPNFTSEDRAALIWPRSADELRGVAAVLLKYRDRHYWTVLIAFCSVYIFLQMFAIPGAIVLSILAGPLFGVFFGLLIVSVVATTGASMCFMLSSLLGRDLVTRCFPTLLTKYRKQLENQKENLIFYLLFLRVSPILPNWFINVSSPLLGVPWSYFFVATFFGLMPANYLHVTTGITLGELNSIHGATLNKRAILTLFGIALLTLIPTLFRKKIKQLDDDMSAPKKRR